MFRDRRPPPEPPIVVVGAPRTPLRDVYLQFLWMRWWVALTVIAAAVLTTNLLFALLFHWVGGVHGMSASLADAFFFSVQTFATIGYGAMYPESTAANVVVTVEALAGILQIALSTGFVLAKFTLSRARITFSTRAAIGTMDGVPTLSIRLGNERENRVVEAQLRLTLTQTVHTSEGETFYRMTDLKLARDRAPNLSRAFSIMHPITPDSPLHGLGPEDYRTRDLEFVATVLGLDETSMQPMHAIRTYVYRDVAWGMRPADLLSERADGVMVVDVRRFDELVPTPPCPAFPYSDGRRVDPS